MLRKAILFLFFISLSAFVFAEQITSSNYQTFIGKKIQFTDTLSKGQNYRIARKKFSSKKYARKIFTIEDIKLDKKENIILFLTTTLDNKKEKKFKLKTHTNKVELENISVLWPPKPQKTIPQRLHNKSSLKTKPRTAHKVIQPTASFSTFHNVTNDSTDTNWSLFWLALLFFVIITVLINKTSKRHKLLKEVENLYQIEDLEEATPVLRGEPSERNLFFKLRNAQFPAGNIFHDLYIPLGDKRFSQIDLILLTDIGLIVFEVKDYSGWIFGNGRQQKWTQVLNYGKEKHRFYNPILQNTQHIKRLKSYLGQNIPCFSMIVFYGNCELKDVSLIPQNTYITTQYSVLSAIENILKTAAPISYSPHTISLLQNAVHNGTNMELRQKHINNIHDMLGDDRIFR